MATKRNKRTWRVTVGNVTIGELTTIGDDVFVSIDPDSNDRIVGYLARKVSHVVQTPLGDFTGQADEEGHVAIPWILFQLSTIGKVELDGPDLPEFDIDPIPDGAIP